MAKLKYAVGILFGFALGTVTQASALAHSAFDPKSVPGALGHPLGQILTVTGTVHEGNQRSKAEAEQLMLTVTKVNQKALVKPIEVKLAFFSFNQTGMPKSGETITYVGYETGAFEGIPAAAFKWMDAVATTDFHFALQFQVCKKLP